MPNPTSQKQGVPMQKSIIFFIRMFPVFFALVSPASQSENPACMKNTKNAPTKVQATLIPSNITISPSYVGGKTPFDPYTASLLPSPDLIICKKQKRSKCVRPLSSGKLHCSLRFHMALPKRHC